MPQGVGVNVVHRRYPEHSVVQDAPQGAIREPSPPLVEEHGLLTPEISAGGAPSRPIRQVGPQGQRRVTAEGNHPFPVALTTHPYQAARQVHVLQVQADQFGSPQASAVKQLQRSPIPAPCGRPGQSVQKFGYLGDSHHLGQRALCPGCGYYPGGVGLDHAFPSQEPEVRAEHGQRTLGRDLGQPLGVQMGQVGANRGGIHRRRVRASHLLPGEFDETAHLPLVGAQGVDGQVALVPQVRRELFKAPGHGGLYPRRRPGRSGPRLIWPAHPWQAPPRGEMTAGRREKLGLPEQPTGRTLGSG